MTNFSTEDWKKATKAPWWKFWKRYPKSIIIESEIGPYEQERPFDQEQD